MTIAGAIRAAAGRGPARTALRMGDATRSYGDLMARIDRVRDATITSLNLRPGDHAAIISANSFAYIEIVCGVPEAGVAIATISNKLARAEMVDALDDAEARVLFADDEAAALLEDADFATVRRVIRLSGDYETLLAEAATPQTLPVVQEWDDWTIPYTSGTTGKPKGVRLPHRARVMVGFLSQTEFGCFGPDDVFLAVSPMNHGAGLGFPLACLQGGGVLDIAEKFDPAAVLRRFKHGGVTGTFLVPTHFHGFFALDQAILDECAQPGLRTIIANAAPLSQAMKRRIIPYFGSDVLYEIYGATESGLVTSLPPAHQLTREASVGLPFAHTRLRVLNDAGEDCAPGEIGEIFSTAPVLFNGYWNRPDETARAFRGEWLGVGDMGRLDADGFLYLVDRKGDMVISGGTNIYPREVEDVLAAHPAIAEIAVTGMPDEKWGESLKAFVVLHPNATLTQPQIAEFCRGRLAGFKIPKSLEIRSALPRNANGKILKRALRTS